MLELYDYQKEGVEFMTSRYHSLNADVMGLGKTVQTIAAFNQLGAKRMLVICPATVKYQWKSMIEEWQGRENKIQVLEGMDSWIDSDCNIIILNYHLLLSDSIRNQLKKLVFGVGVIDEVHYLQSLDAKRTRFILGREGVIRRCVYKFALSGTPMTRPKDLYPLLYTLSYESLGEFDTFEKFAYRYCGAYYDKYTMSLNAKGASNCEEFRERLNSFMIRRTYDVVNLPEVVYDVVPVHIPDYIEIFNHIATQRQETAIEKIKAVADYIIDMVSIVDKFIIFYYHHSVGDKLSEILTAKGISFEKIDGTRNSTQRNISKSVFINSERCVGLFQFQAAGEGLDGLQHVCNQALFFESSWTPKDIQQAVGRLRRTGQKETVFIKFLVVENSIEHTIMKSMIKKRQIIKKILD